jgi:hypothetical protein
MNRIVRTKVCLPELLSLPDKAAKKGVFASEDSFQDENESNFSSFLQVESFP